MKSLSLMLVFAVFVLAGCSRRSAQEYFAAAQKAQTEAERIADTVRNPQDLPRVFGPAIEQYQELIAEHPRSAEAETAQFLIATIRNNNTHEPQRAVEAYTRYVELYPDGKQAALSMFLVGYLYNNELRNLDSAAAAYKRFLEKFPQHEMAPSAQFELNTLGKSPEELLSKQVLAAEKSKKPSARKPVAQKKK